MRHSIQVIKNFSAEKSIDYFKLLLTIGLFYGARMRYVNSLVYGRIHLPLMDGLLVKSVIKETFWFFIRIQWNFVKF